MKEVKDYNQRKDPRLIDCKTECGNDKCYARRYGLFAEKTCQYFVEPKPITNADRIRAMNDEELADLINREIGYCAPTGYCEKASNDCAACWLDWLKQPAEEGTV